MGSIMDIKIEAGKLYKQFFPCCDWVLVGSIAEVVAQQATQPLTIPEAIAAGIENFAPLPILAPIQAGFNNPSTRTCAKATAMKYTIQQFMVDLRDYLDESLSNLAAIAGIAFFVVQATPFRKLIPANALGGIISQFGKDDLIGFINEFLADEEVWENFVCTISEDLDTASYVTGQDVATVYQYFTEFMVGVEASILELLSKFSITDFQSEVGVHIGSVGCECDTYLPSNYEPPLPEGAMMYSFKEFAFASDAFAFPADSDPYNAILAGGARGEMFGGDPSTVGVDNDGTNYNSFLQSVFEFTDVVDLTRIKLFFTYPSGAPSSYGQWSNMIFTTDGAGEWHYGAGWGNMDEVPETRDLTAEFTAFSVGFRTRHTGSYKKAVLSGVLISGTYLGQAFTDLPPDTLFET